MTTPGNDPPKAPSLNRFEQTIVMGVVLAIVGVMLWSRHTEDQQRELIAQYATKEIGAAGYIQVAGLVNELPDLHRVVSKAMADNRITNAEMREILSFLGSDETLEHARGRVTRALAYAVGDHHGDNN